MRNGERWGVVAGDDGKVWMHLYQMHQIVLLYFCCTSCVFGKFTRITASERLFNVGTASCNLVFADLVLI